MTPSQTHPAASAATPAPTGSYTADANPKRFFIFGQGISFSMSPVVHNAAFRYHSLPHTYEILQAQTVDELSHLISSPDFGGASITMPHKLKIGKFCDSVSDQAKIIGAVNTLVVAQDPVSKVRKIVGSNTDWSGLVSCIKATGSLEADCGLVIGAGGASRAALFALYQLGVKSIYLVNRTRSTAEKIARDFSSLFKITVLGSLDEAGDSRPDIIIGTIPADKTTVEDFPQLFGKEKGVCVDMSYKPRSTPLLKAAGKCNGWRVITGVEVLLEQAFDQSQLWLGLPAPKRFMVEALEMDDLEKSLALKEGGKL